MIAPDAGDVDTPGWDATAEQRVDVVTEAAAGALHDLLDRNGERPAVGSPLPLLWHWLAFLPQARHRDLGDDGHPATGSFLPPTGGRARMYGGGRIACETALHVGQPLARHSTVAEVTRKRGRSGELLLVRVDHCIHTTDADAVAIHEQQDLVYRHPQGHRAVAARWHAPLSPADDTSWIWGRDVAIEPTLLFRFSALTYNAHRIHYDRDYATTDEGYPGLVVHGPLQAVLLADAIEQVYPRRFVSSFAFRALAPAFDDQPLYLRLGAADSKQAVVNACAFSGSRHTMTATVTLASESAPSTTPH